MDLGMEAGWNLDFMFFAYFLDMHREVNNLL